MMSATVIYQMPTMYQALCRPLTYMMSNYDNSPASTSHQPQVTAKGAASESGSGRPVRAGAGVQPGADCGSRIRVQSPTPDPVNENLCEQGLGSTFSHLHVIRPVSPAQGVLRISGCCSEAGCPETFLTLSREEYVKSLRKV